MVAKFSPIRVSPGAGMRGVRKTMSMLIDPTTTIRPDAGMQRGYESPLELGSEKVDESQSNWSGPPTHPVSHSLFIFPPIVKENFIFGVAFAGGERCHLLASGAHLELAKS